MTTERSQEIEFIRSEIVGPARRLFDTEGADRIKLNEKLEFDYPQDLLGPGIPVFWQDIEGDSWQEIIHYMNETPLNKYGCGMLFPGGVMQADLIDSNGDNPDDDEHDLVQEVTGLTVQDEDNPNPNKSTADSLDDDFVVTSPDIYRPSTMGVTFCLSSDDGELLIKLPPAKRFVWQDAEDEPFQVNGRYEKCVKIIKGEDNQRSYGVWRRIPATTENSEIKLPIDSLRHGQTIEINVPLPADSPLKLHLKLFPRKIHDQWIVTVVLQNHNQADDVANNESRIRGTLFQTYFEVSVNGSSFSPYPESIRPFDQLDYDEQTLALLYQDSTTWAIGHGCAAGWDVELGDTPSSLYADVMPAVELPSMTPDIVDGNGEPVSLSMRSLSELPSFDKNTDSAWAALKNLSTLYQKWIDDLKSEISNLDLRLKDVAERHMDSCQQSHARIDKGINILKSNENARKAFKLANKCMLLQQIASRQLKKRPLYWNGNEAAPKKLGADNMRSPADIVNEDLEGENIGSWRAFQIAFLLMSLDGIVNSTDSNDREVVDLIWFPTGGGKTEAYLGVAAFYMFYQRLIMQTDGGMSRDGTNVFMRYTLRMLTTQQFQRAASLICSMEYIRVSKENYGLGETRFSLGLWIGNSGSPNKCEVARTQINKFRTDKDIKGNPLVLTDCPWCRSEIGRLEQRPRNIANNIWFSRRLAGFTTDGNNGPVMKCSDVDCYFGGESDSLPIEVIDERIYKNPPSMFIGTADKFAIIAYKPEAGSLFGRLQMKDGDVVQEKLPPGLIIQDEFHLISGPLGTMYGVYEGVIEKLCSFETATGELIKPKIIASTATIRGAQEQVRSVYSRENLQLFPSPGLWMRDSFFGRYAKQKGSSAMASGRLYLGIHAQGYGSFLTTQVRLFNAALFRAWFFTDDKKDAWWTLLAFYNSLREIGGARTLFTSDITSRLKNYSFRYGCKKDKGGQRYLNTVEELTSRKSQSELVQMMDRLSVEWNENGSLDVCLASSIIEVGVDIERLSLMAVVGQPKSTAQYIQVTGRVGRKWWERPGLILAMYNPSKSRDRSHYEQFHSYHRRLYERVEPTSATPFSVEAIERAMAGSLLLWARQYFNAESPGGNLESYQEHLQKGCELFINRCKSVVIDPDEQRRVLRAIDNVYNRLLKKWKRNPQMWQQYPQKSDGEYLMLWPGQFSTAVQKTMGEVIPSSLRNVDGNANLHITGQYFANLDDE